MSAFSILQERDFSQCKGLKVIYIRNSIIIIILFSVYLLLSKGCVFKAMSHSYLEAAMRVFFFGLQFLLHLEIEWYSFSCNSAFSPQDVTETNQIRCGLQTWSSRWASTALEEFGVNHKLFELNPMKYSRFLLWLWTGVLSPNCLSTILNSVLSSFSTQHTTFSLRNRRPPSVTGIETVAPRYEVITT